MTVSLTLANRVQAETVSRSGLQLYSLRDDMERNVKVMLRTIAKMGCKEIESYPGSKGFNWGMPATEFQSFLKNEEFAPIAFNRADNIHTKFCSEVIKMPPISRANVPVTVLLNGALRYFSSVIRKR